MSVQGQHLVPMRGPREIQKYIEQRDVSPTGTGVQATSPRPNQDLMGTQPSPGPASKRSPRDAEGLTNKSIISYQLYQNLLESKDRLDPPEVTFHEFSSIRGFDGTSAQELLEK